MKPHDQSDATPKTTQPEPSPQPRKRFRLEKLEERIAPTAHYNTQSKLVGTGGGGGGGGGGIGTSSGLSYGSIY